MKSLHSVLRTKANVWLTVLTVLAVVGLYLVIVARPFNESSAGFLKLRSKKINFLGPPVETKLDPSDPFQTKVDPINPERYETPPIVNPPTATTAPSIAPAPGTPPSGSVSQLTAPVAGDRWTAGSIRRVKWSAGIAKGTGVGLRLIRNGQRVAGANGVIAGGGTGPYGDVSGEFIRDNGAFDWVLPTSLTVGEGYQIQLINARGQVVATSASFSVAAVANAFQVVAPNQGQEVPFGRDYLLKWRNPAGFRGNVDVAIYQESRGFNGLSYIATRVPAEWLYIVNGVVQFTWSVSAGNNLPQANGNGGIVVPGATRIIVTASDHSASGSSPSFTIR